MPYQGKFNIYHGIAISLLLHLSLALPLFLPALSLAHHRPERLNMELFGMISNRQLAEQHQGTEAPQQTKRAVQPRNNAVPKASANKYQPENKYQAESPVKVEKTDDRLSPSEPVSQPQSMASNSSPAAAGGSEEQVQSYIGQAEPSANEISSYMTRVSKRIQNNLVYPREVKENGEQGITTVAFTITSSGNIQGGSLRVINSSGYQALDASALRTARDSAPFETPPKELDIVVYLSFDVSG